MENYRIELLYQQGKMPKQFYYQAVYKPEWLKLQEQRQFFIEYIQQSDRQQEYNNLLEEQIVDIIENLLDTLS